MKSVIFVLTLILATHCWAQANTDVVEAGALTSDGQAQLTINEETNKEKESPKSIEKIEVTGSYVRRIDVEGPTPVVTIEKQDFEVAGLDTVSDYMRESPMFYGVQDNGNRDGYFNFRGQHAGSTLVLVNGIRVPKLGGKDRGFYTGVENIPTNVIERVEILKDGSSALYGSDAMAGVMNFITKKDYDGVEYSTRVNMPEIGKGLQQNHNLAFGKSYNRGNWFMSAQYVEQQGYTGQDVGNKYKNPTFSPTSDKTFTALEQKPNGEFVRAQQGSTFYRGTCSGSSNWGCNETNTQGFNFIRQPKENIGTLLTGRYDITSDVSLAMVGMYNRRKRMDVGLPSYGNFDLNNNQTPFRTSQFKSTHLKKQTQGANFGELVILPIDEVGARNIEVLQNSYSAQTKLEGYYLDTWNWNLSGSYAYSIEERNHRNGLFDMDTAAGIIQNSPSWSLAGRNTGAFAPANVQGTEAYEASMTTARFVTSGELFDFGSGGPLSMAVGTEGQWESTADAHDANLINQNLNIDFLPNQQGSRSVASAFAEIVAYPLDSLEVQLAGRSDNYSDFGSTFNPKLSVGFRPSNKVLFRSSWGTNFNAPSVRNMIQRNEADFQRVEICPPGTDSCQEQTIQVTRYRDPNLRPEEGVNYNFGTVIQPNRNWTFTIDQWNFEGQGMLARRNGSYYSDRYEALGRDEEALERETGVSFQRDNNGNIISGRFPQVQNTGEKIIRGLDINIAFKSPIRLFGKVMKARLSSDHTHMMVNKVKDSVFSTFRSYQDMEWKNTTSVSVSAQAHSYRLAARTLTGDTTQRFGTTRTSTEYDFNYTYKIPWWTASFSVGVKNMLNSRPPVDLSRNLIDFNRGFNASQFQALGRRYYVGYSHSF